MNHRVRLTLRCKRVYAHHRQRAQQQGEALGYSPTELFNLILLAVDSGCPYCGRLVLPESFSVDHRTPPGRGGRHTLANLLVCCPACNEAKGLLKEAEFRELLALLEAWPPLVRLDVLARLRSGGKARGEQFRRG